MQFKEIIGQENIKKRLIQSVADNRVSHAQLFLGPEGSGSLALAIAYSQYICCENKTAEDSCGTCPSCKKHQKLIHPDLHFVFPVNTNKDIKEHPISDNFINYFREAVIKNPYLNLQQWLEFIGIENKQGIIATKESNEITRKLSLMTYEAEYKVMVIWFAEKMHPTTSNKLLKLLEEPPEKTLFMLVCENQEQILPTVFSRTQLIKILKISDEDLLNFLIQKKNLTQEVAEKIVFLSEGNYLETQKLLTHQNETEQFFFNNFVQWMRLCFSDKVVEITEWVETIPLMGRERQKSFLSYCLHIIRESLIRNYGDRNLIKMSGAERDFLIKFSPFINGANCIQLTEEFEKAYLHIERNANPKILFLDLSLKIIKLLKVK